MISVKYIPNILSESNRKSIDIPFVHGESIEYYLKQSKFDFEGRRITASFCQKNVEDLSRPVLDDGEEIIITHRIGDPISAIVSVIWAAIVAHPFLAAMWALTIGYSIYQAMTFRKPSMPTFGMSGDGLDTSPTYSWDGMQTTREVGLPIPIVYGRHAVPGNAINEYIWTDGDKNYLNTLLCLSEGEIDAVESLEINENPSTNFSGIETEYRYGTNTQSVMSHFQDLHDVHPVGATLLKNVPYVYTTELTDVEAFEIRFMLPNGVFLQDQSSGAIEAWQVQYKVEYRQHDGGSWWSLGTTTIDAKQRSSLRRVFSKTGLTAQQYDIRVTKLSDDSDFYHTGDLQLESVDEVRTDDLEYPNLALASIRALATDQLSGPTPNYKVTIRGVKVRVPKILDGPGGSEVDWEDYYWDSTAQKWMSFVTGNELYWDGATYTTKWSANPIWCMRDLLLNERYGLGNYIASNVVDDTTNLEMAKYCEERVSDGNGGYEKRFRLDVVIDSVGKALDVLAQLCTSFRGVVLYAAGNVKVKIEKPETPVQLFGMGNIISGSFSESWKSKKECYNILEVTFANQDKGYAQETVAVIDHDAIAGGQPQRKKAVRIYTTKLSYAVREGQFLLRVSQNIKRAVSFRASMSALACMAFDVISFSHDVPQIGFSGLIRSGSTTTSVFIDREVTISNGTTYKLRIGFKDGTVEEKTVSSPAGTYARGTAITVSGAFSQAPERYDVYSFGEDTKVKKDYRIISLRREQNYEVSITALEYVEAIYTDGTLVIPTDNYSALTNTVPLVLSLQLTEGVTMLPDGTIKSTIDVWFRKPDDTGYANRYQYAKIYLSEDGGTNYYAVGTTYTNTFVIDRDLVKSTTYYVKVVTYCANGVAGTLSGSPSASITISGKTGAPSNVPSLNYTWGENLDIYWGAVTNSDLAGYELRDEDANWGTDDAHMIYRGMATKKMLKPSTRSPGTYYVKAFNTSGVYSATAASSTPTNDAPDAPTVTSEGWFGFNVLKWTDSVDDDILYYEVYRSATNLWAGEEALYKRVSGTQAQVVGNDPEDVTAASPDATSITDASLIGKGVDYFVGDRLLQTTGTYAGQEATITAFDNVTGKVTVASWPSGTPTVGDLFVIKDRAHYEVRGVDRYGGGDFSSAVSVDFLQLAENELGDQVITARKVTTGELITLSAQIKDAIITSAKIFSLVADKITTGSLAGQTLTGGTIQTAVSGARVVLSENSLICYDNSGNEVFKVILTGVDVGDVIFGNSLGAYIKWDKSAGLLLVADLQSPDYVAGTTGYKLSSSSGLEINTGTIQGTDIIAKLMIYAMMFGS